MGKEYETLLFYIQGRICFKFLWLKAVIMKDIPNLQASAPKIERLSNSHVQHKTVLDTNYNKLKLQ